MLDFGKVVDFVVENDSSGRDMTMKDLGAEGDIKRK